MQKGKEGYGGVKNEAEEKERDETREEKGGNKKHPSAGEKGRERGEGEAQPVNKYKRLLLHLLPVFVVERKEKKVPDERGWK